MVCVESTRLCVAFATDILLKKCNIIRIPNNVLFIPTPCNPELLSIDFFNNSRLNQILELAHSKSGKYTRITWTWSLTMKTASLYIVPKVIVFPRSRKLFTTRNISCSISFSPTFRVISWKFGLLFGQCKIYRDAGSIATVQGPPHEESLC